MTTLQGAALALVVALALSPGVLALLRRKRLLDLPNARSSHVEPTPRGGGVALLSGALAGIALAAHGHARDGLLVAGAGMGLIGVAEDVWGIAPLPRLGLQAGLGAACLPLLAAGLRGPVAWHVAFATGVVVWIVAYANGFNFMDGIDGISVAQAVAGGLAYWWLGWRHGVPGLAAGGLAVAASALGFAPFNLPRARMFLGDVGSYGVGGLLAALVVIGLRAGLAPIAVLAPVALYLADTGSTLARRVSRGEVWHQPHRDHAYQQLVRRGWSHPQVSLLVAMAIGACGLLGVAGARASVAVQLGVAMGVGLVVIAYLALPAAVDRRAGRTTMAGPG
jgi:UDP-N-acetylmuramyl pentapeptide phosphotransferase/UDP-N-acetylglucosamine-1-phosphate transferase